MADQKRQRRANGNDNGEAPQRRGDGSRDRHGFTAFNMEDENDEGHFDDNGNFIWKKEEKSVQEEAWLDIVSEDQIEAAKSAKDRKSYREEQEEEELTEDQANSTLASLLQPRETVLQALQRLGRKRSKTSRGSSSNKRKQAGDGGVVAQTPEEKQQFDKITEAADFLMRMGEVDVYSQMKEEFIPEEELLAQRQAQREQQVSTQQLQSASSRSGYFGGGTDSTSTAATAVAGGEATTTSDNNQENETMWEYKGADGLVHGPFPTSTLVAWRQQGYFIGENAVDMRIISQPKTSPTTATAAAEKDEENPKEEKQMTAEEELMNDFEDSDDEDNGKEQGDDQTAATTSEWKRSDQIDFASHVL